VVYPETRTDAADVHWYGGTLTFGYRPVYGGFDVHYSDDERFRSRFAAFQAAVSDNLRQGLPWMGLFVGHPIAIRAYEFGDVLNFRHGTETPPEHWAQPPLKPEAEYRTALANLDTLVTYVAHHPRLQVSTVGPLATTFGGTRKWIGRHELHDYAARACAQSDIFTDDPALSPAEAVDLLAKALLAHQSGAKPATFTWRHVDGPLDPPIEIGTDVRVAWRAFCAGCAQALATIDRTGHLPAAVELGDARVGIGSFYRVACEAFAALTDPGAPETLVARLGVQVPAIADDIARRTERGYRGWVIHRRDLDATALLELTRLQAWTLKPAVKRA
jgi:hypothetical protein